MLAAGKDSGRQLMGVSSRQNENDMGRWLFQCLEQGVSSLFSEHVDFVNNIDLVVRSARHEGHLLTQAANFVNTAVGRGIQLDHIHRIALGDRLAYCTLVTGLTVAVVQAINGFGQDTAGAGLTSAPGAGE